MILFENLKMEKTTITITSMAEHTSMSVLAIALSRMISSAASFCNLYCRLSSWNNQI